MSQRALFNLPNTISLSRVVLALAFVLVSEPWDRIALIAVAGFTDFMDGWLARRGKGESTAGALLDPLADRIFVLVAISTYLVEGVLTSGQYFVFLTRDLATAAGFIVAKIIPTLRPAVFRARLLGKIVTVVQLITLVAIIVLPELTDALVMTIGVVSAASIIDYTIALWRGRARSRVALFVAAIALPAVARGQLPQLPLQVEGRVDGIFARTAGVEAGLGLTVPAGIYVRTGLVAGAGLGRHGAEGRTDLVSRFSLDPFRQSHWAPYAGGGISVRYRAELDGGSHAYLMIFLGVEGALSVGQTEGWVPAVELGLGGGARVAVVLRRGINARR